jgi:hypothetical protein
MDEEEFEEYVSEFRDSNSRLEAIQALKDLLVQELESFSVDTSRQEHDLNLAIRDLEEELDWIENEKLSGFDPEQE